MAIRCPGVRPLRAGEQVTVALTGRNPEPEGAVDMHPGLCRLSYRAHSLERIEAVTELKTAWHPVGA